MTKIRDFIYLDVERLYSLYSQVFEGVADRIIQSHIDSLESKDSYKAQPLLQDSDIETKVVEVSRRTENKFLYDFMYNKLEEKLGNAILYASDLPPQDYLSKIKQSFIIAVRGDAEIEDFEGVKDLFEKFNHIGEAIHYISTFDREQNQTIERTVEESQRKIKNTRDRNQKAKLEQVLKKSLQDIERKIRESAQKTGLGFDERYLKYLSELTEQYYSNRLDVTIDIFQGDDVFAFRGVLDRKWLRIQPEALQHLYSGTASNWTMTGQITHITELGIKEDIPNLETDSSVTNIRSSFSNIAKRFYDIVRHFTTDTSRFEFIVSPLAIYRESKISNHSKTKSK